VHAESRGGATVATVTDDTLVIRKKDHRMHRGRLPRPFSELEIKVSNRLEKRSTQNNLRTEVGLHFKRHAGSSPSGGPSADQRPTLPGYPLRCRGPCRHTIGCRTSANDVQTLQAILSSFVVLRPLPQWNAV
jgi:hypothetical protein